MAPPVAMAPGIKGQHRPVGSGTSETGSYQNTLDREPQNDVLVACPDARTPAYQAVVGLARAGRLSGFVTGYYYGDGPFWHVVRRLAPRRFARWERMLRRRHESEIPVRKVHSDWGFDLR